MKKQSQYTPERLYPTGRYYRIGEHLRAFARDESAYVPPLNALETTPRLDAVAVPTYRARKKTRGIIRKTFEQAAKHQVSTLIFLCSGEASKEHIAQVAHDYPQQSWLAIDWNQTTGYREPQLATAASYLSRGKNFNAAEKRNFILELARLMGWHSVLFLDDDIEITSEYMDKAAQLLNDGAEVVGFNVREFPDHSVVVHANQIVNNPVDSFVGAGAMAVRTDTPFLSFFPNSYNNDWLFSLFHSLNTDNSLVWAGTVRQKQYSPFRTPARAEREEPGDLLGEGLFRLVMEIKSKDKLPKSTTDRLALVAKMADETFWEAEITRRVNFVHATLERAKRRYFLQDRIKMIQSLRRSLEAINGYGGFGGLTAKDFADWVKAWVNDLDTWNKYINSRKSVGNLEQALRALNCDFNYLYGSGAKTPLEDSESKRRHILYEFLKGIGESKFDDAVYSHNNRKFMQEFASVKGDNLLRIVNGTDKLRHDRPASDMGVKPVVSVVMFVRVGEPTTTVQESIRALASHAKDRPPIQLILWAYTDGNDTLRQLNKFRNLLASEIIQSVQRTNILLASGLVKVGGKDRSVDQLIRKTSEDMLIAYWKLGRMPLPEHYFVAVNSRNEPLRAGPLKQLVQQEHGLADKSLEAYLAQYIPREKTPIVIEDGRDAITARERISQGNRVRKSWLARGLYLLPTLALIWAMKRARLSLPLIDDLAQTVEFHDPRGWSSVNDIRISLCVRVQYRQSLPGDIYGVARRIATDAKQQLMDSDHKGCMVVVTGEPGDPWADMQKFREDIIEILTSTGQTSDIVFTSLAFRRSEKDNPNNTSRIVRAMTRYIYWLENHRIRQRFAWHHINN